MRTKFLELLLLISSFSFAQQLAISGKVTNFEGFPLPGVNVVIANSTKGTQTDIDGKFFLEVNLNDVLVFSFVGYKTKELPIFDKEVFYVILESELTLIDEILITGYGRESKRLLTDNVARIDIEGIVETSNPNLFDDPINHDQANFYYADPNSGLSLTSKFMNEHSNLSLARLAEVYLIRAKCNHRLATNVGNNPLDDINLVQSRAGAQLLNTLDISTILTERKRELSFEGFLIHDIKRTKQNVGNFTYNDPKLVCQFL